MINRNSSGQFVIGDKLAQFFQKVSDYSNKDVCWVWLASKDKNGYGWFGRKKAHRVSYEMHVGKIPEKMLVCHSCDTPSCVNPSHLWVGTNKQNIQDRQLKGRHKSCGVRGSKHHNSKLTEKIIIEIKSKLSLGFTQARIAGEYGVSHQTISNIKRGLVWRDN